MHVDIIKYKKMIYKTNKIEQMLNIQSNIMKRYSKIKNYVRCLYKLFKGGFQRALSISKIIDILQ